MISVGRPPATVEVGKAFSVRTAVTNRGARRAGASTVVFLLTAEPGSIVRTYTDPACAGAAAGSGQTDGDGDFAIPTTVPADAASSIRAAATDAAGNVSACSAPFAYVEDATAPAEPVIVTTTPPSPSGTDTTPQVSVTGEAGATLTLFATADCTGPAADSDTRVGADRDDEPGRRRAELRGRNARGRAGAAELVRLDGARQRQRRRHRQLRDDRRHRSDAEEPGGGQPPAATYTIVAAGTSGAAYSLVLTKR